jgi:acylphosphatase
MNEARHVFVSGRVQGVGYRFHTHERATALGLSGWVRNLPDGRVEALIQGPPEAISAMLEWFHDGPRSASVSHVEFDVVPYLSEIDGFHIR